MDQEVLNDLWERAKSKGYSKSIEEFQALMESDSAVFNDNFEYVKSKGYKKSVEEFSKLVISEKKNQVVTPSGGEEAPTASTTATETAPGSSASLEAVKYSSDYLSDLSSQSESEDRPRVSASFSNPVGGHYSRLVDKDLEDNPEARAALETDFNIQRSIETGVINRDIIDKALKGDKNAIKKLRSISISSPAELASQIAEKDLNNPNSYEKLSELEAENIEESTFNSMYGASDINMIGGFNAKDFDGYMKEQGYYEEYLRLLDDETVAEDGREYDYSGNYNPSLASERVKLGFLTNYINDRVERNVESQILNYKLSNEGKHPGLDNVQVSFSSGVDGKQLASYIEKSFPILTSKLKVQDIKNQELYQEYKSGDNPVAMQMLKQGWRSMEDRINSFTAATYDWVGLDSVADEIRMNAAESEMDRGDFLRYTYASGKKASVDGIEYLVDDKGQVYDLDSKIRVTNVLPENKLAHIRGQVQKKGVPGSSYSQSGATVATAGIAADMLLQVALTKGVGVAGQGVKGGLALTNVGGKAVGLLSKVPMNATTASAMIAQGQLFSTSLYEDTRKQAEDAGMTPEDVDKLSAIAARQGYALGTLTAPLSTQAYAMNKIFGKNATDKLIKGASQAYLKGGEKAATTFWKQAQQKAINYVTTYGKEGVKETFQENVQQGGQTFIIGENVNEAAGKEIMANTITGDEFVNTTVLSLYAGVLMPFGGDVVSNVKSSYNSRYRPGVAAIEKMKMLQILSIDPNKTTELLNKQVTQGLYTEEQVANLLKDVEIYRSSVNSIPTNLSPETALSVMSDISDINKQKNLKEQMDDPVFHPPIDEKIMELRNNIIKKTNFDYVSKKTKKKLKDEASKELTAEAEERGDKDFEIDDSQITNRAIDNFNELTMEEQLSIAEIETKTEEDAVQEPSTEKVDVQKPAGDGEGVGDINVEQEVTQEGESIDVQEDAKATPTEEAEVEVTPEVEPEVESVEPFTTKRERQPETLEVPRSRSVDVKIDADGKPIAINRKTGKPLDKTAPVGVQKFMLESAIDVNEGAMAVIPESSELSQEQYGFEVAEKSNNVREVADAISNEEKRLAEQKDEDRREAADPLDIQGTIFEVTEEDFARYGDKNSITTQIRKHWFKKKPKASAGKMFGDSRIKSTLDADVMALQGYTPENSKEYIEKVIEFIIDNPTGTLDTDTRKSGPIGDLKIRFTELTGLNPTKANIKTVLAIDPNRKSNTAMSERSKDRDQEAASRPGEFSAKKKSPPVEKLIDHKPTRKDKAKPEKENAQRKRFWKSWNKAWKESKLDLKGKRKQLTDRIDAYAEGKKGTITAAQARAVIKRVNRVNLDNPLQVQDLIAYSEKVFNDADYVAKEEKANKLKKATTKKLNTGRFGIGNALQSHLAQVLNVPVSDLNSENIDAYNEFLSKIGKRERKTKLTKELITEVSDLYNEIFVPNKEVEEVQEKEKNRTKEIVAKINDENVSGEQLLESESKFIQKDLDKIDSITLENLIDKINSITDPEMVGDSEVAKIINEANEYAENRQNLLNLLIYKSKKLDTDNVPKMSVEAARTFKNLGIEVTAELTGSELLDTEVHIDNISEGYYTHPANVIKQKIVSIKRSYLMMPVVMGLATAKARLATARSIAIGAIKANTVGRGGSVGSLGHSMRSNPLSVIDNVFGNYENSTIRDNSFEPLATMYQKYISWINENTDVIDAAEKLIAPGLKESINESVKRRFEITAFLLALESESNKEGENETDPAQSWIKSTIDKYLENPKKSNYSEKDIEILKGMLSNKKYIESGWSSESIKAGMTDKAKKAAKLLQGVYSGLGEMQAYATTIVRGNKLDLVNNYVHHKTHASDDKSDTQLQSQRDMFKSGTKSATSITRTGGSKSIDFDPISTVLRAVRATGLDYFLTDEIQTGRKTLSRLKSGLEKETDKKIIIQGASDLKEVYEEALGNVLQANFSTDVVGGKYLDAVRRMGYYATLASVPRAVAELTSNLSYAILSEPVAITLGMTKYGNLGIGQNGLSFAQNVGSTTVSKNWNDEILGGSKADQGGVVRGKKSSKSAKDTRAGEILEFAQRFLGQGAKGAEAFSNALLSTPDKMISRPLFFGVFARKFKDITGQDMDVDKISANDPEYMAKHEDAIRKSKIAADKAVTRAATSNDPFSGILKNQLKEGEGAMNMYRTINSYMARFSINEYATARQAVAGMMGRGEMTRIQGAAVMTGVLSRMTIYVVLYKYLQGLFYGAVGAGDDDDTDYESLAIRQLAGAATALVTRGVSGNIAMIPVNFGIEQLNKEFGYDFGLREDKEYDSFRDAMVYSSVNASQLDRDPYKQLALIASGPAAPMVKSMDYLLEKSYKALSSNDRKTREKALEELISFRGAIELMNLMMVVPGYKDIRGALVKEQYKDYGKETFDPSMSDLKKYAPEVWRKLKKQEAKMKNSSAYKKQQRKIKKIKDKYKN